MSVLGHGSKMLDNLILNSINCWQTNDEHSSVPIIYQEKMARIVLFDWPVTQREPSVNSYLSDNSLNLMNSFNEQWDTIRVKEFTLLSGKS